MHYATYPSLHYRRDWKVSGFLAINAFDNHRTELQNPKHSQRIASTYWWHNLNSFYYAPEIKSFILCFLFYKPEDRISHKWISTTKLYVIRSIWDCTLGSILYRWFSNALFKLKEQDAITCKKPIQILTRVNNSL